MDKQKVSGVTSDGYNYSFSYCRECGMPPVVIEKLVTTISVKCRWCGLEYKTYGQVLEIEEKWNN